MWQPAPRTKLAAAAYEAAEADRIARPDRYRLEAEAIVAAATARGASSSDFSPGWSEALDRYLDSAAVDGHLNALGTAMVARTAVSRLRAGAAMTRFLSTHRTVAETPMAPPIFITGGWRTGTTFLFRLLASDPRLRAPLPAELAAPTLFHGVDDDRRATLIRGSAAAHDGLHALNPHLRSIHDSGADLPEECGLGMGTDMHNWAFSATTRLESYSGWLAEQDLDPTYERYRSVLQTLDRGDGRRWVLKAPPHIAELSSLAGAFPGAVVVVLHRDIAETITSGSSLFAVFRSTYSDRVDPFDVGRFQTEQTERWLTRAQRFRESAAFEDATVLDLPYRSLVADPGAALKSIYRAAGMEQAADIGAFVASYHRTHPRHEHGHHRYAPEDFGLDAAALRERFEPLTMIEP